MHMIRKGQMKGVNKGDVTGQKEKEDATRLVLHTGEIPKKSDEHRLRRRRTGRRVRQGQRSRRRREKEPDALLALDRLCTLF